MITSLPTPLHALAALQRRFPLLQIAAIAALYLYGAGSIDGFGERSSLYSMLVLAALLGLAALGQTLVVLIGGVDLSIPALIVLGGTMISELTGAHGWSFVPALALVVALAFAIGSVSGWVCHRFGVESLVVTLGIGSIVAGGMLVWTGGQPTGTAPEWLSKLTGPTSTTLSVAIPPVVVVWAVVALVVGVVLARSLPGRRLYATGANPRAAGLALVRTGRTKIAGFAISAIAAALVGILLAGFAGSGDATIGDPYLFQSLAAVIVGGTALIGARGDYWRTVLGALLLTLLTTILVGNGYEQADQQIVFGALILIVVAGYGRDRRLCDRI
jgi:ribose transport system permease protein